MLRTFALTSIISYELPSRPQSLIPFQDRSTDPAAHVVGNLSCETFVVHEEKVHFPYIIDEEFFEPVWK